MDLSVPIEAGQSDPDSPHRERDRDKREKSTMATEAYCVKCREKREMKDEKDVTMKNGRPALEGVCPVCGTKLFRLKSTKKAAAS